MFECICDLTLFLRRLQIVPRHQCHIDNSCKEGDPQYMEQITIVIAKFCHDHITAYGDQPHHCTESDLLLIGK